MRVSAVLATAAVFLVAAGWIGAAQADACSTKGRCAAQCDRNFPDGRDEFGRTGCLARCGWDHATCEAQRALDETQAALDRAKPWLDDQTGRWQRFLDGFRGGGTSAPQRSSPERAPERPPGLNPAPTPEPGTRRSTPL
jgi:hypothetical protein